MWCQRFSYRSFVTALLALAVTQTDLMAQRRVRTGLTGALVSSTLDSPDDQGTDRRTGFAAGVTVAVPLASSLSLVTGLTYAQKGATASGTAEDIAIDAAIELAYLQIPAVLRYGFAGGQIRPYVEGGAAFAVRVGCKVKASFGGLDASADCADAEDEAGNTSDPVEKTDVSAIVGAGLDIGKWAAGIRYDHGLTNLDKSGDSSVKNRAFLLTFTYWLGR